MIGLLAYLGVGVLICLAGDVSFDEGYSRAAGKLPLFEGQQERVRDWLVGSFFWPAVVALYIRDAWRYHQQRRADGELD